MLQYCAKEILEFQLRIQEENYTSWKGNLTYLHCFHVVRWCIANAAERV